MGVALALGTCECGCGTAVRRRFVHGHNPSGPPRTDTRARLLTKIVDADGCWEWQGWIDAKGYGHVWAAGTMNPAHRVAYEVFVGPIPAGLQIDHLCRNRRCVRPDHLEPVTAWENRRRGVLPLRDAAQRARAVCSHGHALSGDNLYVRPTGTTCCRICRLDQGRRHDAVRRQRRAKAKR